MLKIWGRKNSINVQKVLWCCGELGIKFERIDAGMEFGVNNTPEYRAMNPNGLVPTIDHDGFILWESHAILRYLCGLYGVGKLWPSALREFAEADRWMDWYHTKLWANLRPVFWQLVRVAPEKRDMPLVEENAKKLADHFAIADAHLTRNAYFGGKQFTMGDIPIGVAAFRWFNVPVERPKQPHFEAWFKRISERPAFREYCAAPLT